MVYFLGAFKTQAVGMFNTIHGYIGVLVNCFLYAPFIMFGAWCSDKT